MGRDRCTGTTAPPLSSGLLLSGYDRQVRAQDNLFRFANGQWLRTTEIPADKIECGVEDPHVDEIEQNLRTIVAVSATRHGRTGSPDQQIGDFYASFMDTARLDALGAAPLKKPLDRIDALTNPADLVRYFGESIQTNMHSPITLYVGQDARDASTYIPYVSQSGLTLLDRDYYLRSDSPFATIRKQFRAYAARVLGLAGVADPDAAAGRILAVENRLAKIQWPALQERGVSAIYNKFIVADATARTPGLDWKTYLDAAGVHTPDFVLAEPSYFTALGDLLSTVPLGDWKLYLKFKAIDQLAHFLSDDFVTARFEFRGRDLAGQQEMGPRWKWGIAVVDNAMGDLLGQRYVQRHFPPDAKRRISVLVGKLIDAYRWAIDGLDWMSDTTKAEAKDKLRKLVAKIGHPTKWKDYSKLTVVRDDLVGNVLRATRLEYQRNLDRLGKPVDRDEWFVTPHTINAFYDPLRNDITVPAAVLQPPAFDATADDAVNYGAIGAVIGHEISHAFDDHGRKFDGTGNLRDWWTPQDAQRFTARTSTLIAQYSAYEPLPGQHINGELTLGENIADLSGLAMALRAYRLSLGGQRAAVMDGFTGEQRLFLGWAQMWRGKIRDQALQARLLSDPHSPKEFRTNGVVSNLAEYHTAFGVKPGDKLYRPPDQRVKIW